MVRFARLISLAFLAAALAWAQTGTGSIQGTVKDASGAVVPGAAVTATHLATSRAFETKTNEVGFYLFPSLQMGRYKLAVSFPGMEAWEGDMLLQSGQSVSVDPTLKVGATATQVTVAGEVTPLITTTNATLGSVLERTRLEQLPLNGRYITGLILRIVPGLEGRGAAPRVFGLRENSMEYLQDGAVLANRSEGDTSGRPPGIDSIEEMQVETNNSSAKVNRPATAIFVTKAGTNDLHGAAFWTARNNSFGIARRRQEYWTKAPFLIRNEFGASLGGPVYLPKLYSGKNRTFFFFAYEATRNSQATTISTTVPTLAMRQGDFSGLRDSTGRAITIYDPWTTDSKTWQRQPYPGNRIPIARQSPLAKYLYSITPVPTNNENPLIGTNYIGPFPTTRPDHTETARVDHRISDRDQLFGRFSHGRRLVGSSTGTAVANNVTNISYNIYYPSSGVLSWTHSFSPTLFSEFLANGSQEDYTFAIGEYGTFFADQLGLPNPFRAPGFPGIGSTGLGTTYSASSPRASRTRVMNFDLNLTKIHGRHTFHFGGRKRYERNNNLPDQQQVCGNHQFGSASTALYDPASGTQYGATPRTGHQTANQFLGLLETYSNQFVRGMYRLRLHEYALYFQDDFKVNSRLTLNLGVRWEFEPPITEADNFITGFNTKTHAVVNGMPIEEMYRKGAAIPAVVNTFTRIGMKFETPREAGLPDRLMYSNYWDFGPRAGFAYRFSSGPRSFVLRGGYAIYGFPLPTRTFEARMRVNPPINARFEYMLNASNQSPDGLPNYHLRSVPGIIAGVNSRDVIDLSRPNAVGRGSFATSVFDPHQPTTRAHEWNLTLEREIMHSTVARLGYVGTHGARLEQYYTFNTGPNSYIWYTTTGLPLPTGEFSGVATRPFDQTTFGSIESYQKTGWSNFNGVQFEVRRQYSRGYGFQVYYVMSNALAAGGRSWSEDFTQTTSVFLPGAVPADFQERNRFLSYRRDTGIPKHRAHWNWIVDLPFGRGKTLGNNAGGFLDRLIGGWQIAGFGSVRSNYWSLPTGNWGYLGKVEVYGKKYPIEDCRSGTCYQGWLWYNGYIPANRINSYDAAGRPNGVMGVPANYQPAHKPIFPTPANGGSPSDPNYPYYESNTTWVRLKDGTLQRTSLDTNLHPWRQQYLPGIRSWGLDASLFKAVRVNERFTVRVNADFFNVLNMPGLNQPDSSSGIVSTRNSANEPRNFQLTLRLQW